MINLNICLSDIPKEKIFVSEKSGKKYISITCQEKREIDQYGKTHSLYISQSKEEREAKTPKTYVGDGKEYLFDKSNATTAAVKEEPKPTPKKVEENDDLPF